MSIMHKDKRDAILREVKEIEGMRPVLSIPRSPLEVVMELVSFLGIFAVFLLLLRTWPDLPDLVPQHFGFTGEPDAWGSKRTLLFLPAVGIGLYLLLTIVSRFPHAFNYLVTITEENAWEQYRLARLLMGWLKLEIIWIFTFLQYKTVMVALGKAEGLGISALVFVGINFATIFYYFYRSRRMA